MPVREKSEAENAHAAEMRHEQAVHQGRRPARRHRQPMPSALAPPPPHSGVHLLGHLFRELISSCPGFQPASDVLRRVWADVIGAAVRLRGPNASAQA